jgi:hypothetical protein
VKSAPAPRREIVHGAGAIAQLRFHRRIAASKNRLAPQQIDP